MHNPGGFPIVFIAGNPRSGTTLMARIPALCKCLPIAEMHNR